jgi:hypothetical protein
MSKTNRHLVIPDGQCKQGVRTSHWAALGNYIAEWQPQVIVNIGDFFDLPSLCVYDKDLADVTQRRLETDIRAGNFALQALMRPWHNVIKGYRPRLIYTLGNHEDRFNRLLDEQPRLRGAIDEPWAWAKDQGWRVYPFLQPVTVDGVAYCHLFAKSSNGRVTSQKWGAPNARAQVLREMRSCTAGHKPGLDSHIQPVGRGAIRGIIAGSFYAHNEEFLTPQDVHYWRGVLVKHDVRQGQYDLMEVSLKYLLRKWA